MHPIVINSQIDGNGILHVDLPAGTVHAGQEVRVTVEPIGQPALSQEEWRKGILETAGKWEGEFERPDQGEYEQREPLS